MHRITCSIACVVVGIVLFGCGDNLNKSNYDRINIDMSRQEVETILGEPTKVATGGIAGVPPPDVEVDESAAILNWNSGDRMIIVNIVQDKVVSKSKRGF